MVREAVHRRKDGSTFLAEVTFTALGQGADRRQLAIVRDTGAGQMPEEIRLLKTALESTANGDVLLRF